MSVLIPLSNLLAPLEAVASLSELASSRVPKSLNNFLQRFPIVCAAAAITHSIAFTGIILFAPWAIESLPDHTHPQMNIFLKTAIKVVNFIIVTGGLAIAVTAANPLMVGVYSTILAVNLYTSFYQPATAGGAAK